MTLTELASFSQLCKLLPKLNSPQVPLRGVTEGIGTPVTPSGISWKVTSGNSDSVFFKNFANLCLLRLILDGGTFFLAFPGYFGPGSLDIEP